MVDVIATGIELESNWNYVMTTQWKNSDKKKLERKMFQTLPLIYG